MRKRIVILSICIVIIIAAMCIARIFISDAKKIDDISDSNGKLSQTSGVTDTTSNNNLAANPVSDEGSASSGNNGNSGAESGDKTENKILNFVDVFGQEYETEILDDVPKHDYDLSKFTHDGSKLSYADDRYSYRLGIDVSHHQGSIDFAKVKAAGFDFVFLRIGYRGYGEAGTINADKKFAEYYQQAKAAGLDVGVYFFAQAINETEAGEEADFVINTLKGYELDLPVVYDPESILDDVARTDNVSGEQFTKNTIAFCQKISDAGYGTMVYSNMLWEAFEFDMTKISDYPIWYADYEALPQTPYEFSYWQYSNEGTVDGVSGAVDVDIELIKK